MGLDLVEFVMAIEERFDISIPDEDVATIATPRALMDYVANKVEVQDELSCLSQKAFHILRRGFMHSFGLSRSAIRVDSSLNDLIPVRQRRQHWKQLADAVGATDWPDLSRSTFVISVIAVFSLVSFLLLPAALSSIHISMLPTLISLSGASLVLFVGLWATQPLKTRFRLYRNVEDMVRFLIAKNSFLVKAKRSGWTREEIQSSVRQIVVEQFGISNFNDDDRFIEDIGVD